VTTALAVVVLTLPEALELRLALPLLAGTAKNARRLDASLERNSADLDQFTLDLEELKTLLKQLEPKPTDPAQEAIPQTAGVPVELRVAPSLHRTCRLAIGLLAGRLEELERQEQHLEHQTESTAQRRAALVTLQRRFGLAAARSTQGELAPTGGAA